MSSIVISGYGTSGNLPGPTYAEKKARLLIQAIKKPSAPQSEENHEMVANLAKELADCVIGKRATTHLQYLALYALSGYENKQPELQSIYLKLHEKMNWVKDDGAHIAKTATDHEKEHSKPFCFYCQSS